MTVKDANLDVLPKPGLIINGEHMTMTGGGETEHIYAATGKPTVRVPLAGAKEIDEAVQSARKAFRKWRAMPRAERRGLLLRLSHLLLENADSLAKLMVVENSTPILITSTLPKQAAELFEYNAGWADKLGGDVIDTGSGAALDYTLEEPCGVVAVILPWNAPFYQMSMIVAPALAAGNCLVVKPSSITPFTAIRFGELCLEAGFPPGVVNVVPTGSGGGQALCLHPGVNKINLTGSVATAQAVMASASKNITPVGFELGGKSATIVFDDVDPQAAAQFAVQWIWLLSGQACIKGARVLVQSGIYERVVELCKVFAEQVVWGDPAVETTMMGPVVNATQCNEIMGFINRAKENKTGRLITGGERLTGELAAGCYIAPTIFADVDNSAEICQKEVFGPVLTLTRFDTDDEAIRIANDTDFGLAGYVLTDNLKRAHNAASALTAGNIWINQFTSIPASVPFGGIEMSGFGRVGGIEGIREFTRSKNVWIPL